MAFLLIFALFSFLAPASANLIGFNPTVQSYGVAQGDSAMVRCGFGDPVDPRLVEVPKIRPVFEVYRDDEGTLVNVKNVTITWRRLDVDWKRAMIVRVTIPGLSVGVHDIVVRASAKNDGLFVDCNVTVFVVPLSIIPNITLFRIPVDYETLDVMECQVSGGSMLPGLVSFEHFVNNRSVKKASKVHYHGKIWSTLLWPYSNDLHACIVKLWLGSTQQLSRHRRPWTLSTTADTLPSTALRVLPMSEHGTTAPLVPVYIVSTTTATTTETKTKVVTMVKTATSEACRKRTVPINSAYSCLPATVHCLGVLLILGMWR